MEVFMEVDEAIELSTSMATSMEANGGKPTTTEVGERSHGSWLTSEKAGGIY